MMGAMFLYLLVIGTRQAKSCKTFSSLISCYIDFPLGEFCDSERDEEEKEDKLSILGG